MNSVKCIMASITALTFILSVCSEVTHAVSDNEDIVLFSEQSENNTLSESNVSEFDSEPKPDQEEEIDENTIGDMSLIELAEMELADFEIPEVISISDIEKQKNVNRLYLQEPDEYTAVFQNRDGSKTMYVFSEPIKYIDENGVAWDKHTQLSSDVTTVNSELSADYAYVNLENDVHTFFPEKLSIDSGMMVSSGKYSVELTPKTDNELSAQSSDIITMTSTNGHEKDYIEYEDVFSKDSKIRYSASLNGMKEDIILDSYNGINCFSFVLKTNGLEVIDADGYFILTDPDSGKEVGGISELILLDSSNGENTIVPQGYITGYDIEEITDNQEYIITISIDNNFLENEAVYPVTIDPSITFKGSSSQKYVYDAPLYSKKPNTNFGSSTIGTVGYQDCTYGVGRLLLRFPCLDNNALYKRLKGNEIVSAKVALYEGTGNSSTSTLTTTYSFCKSSWAENYPTYSNALETQGSSMSTTKISKSGYAYFDFTSLAVQDKYNAYDIKKGIIIKNQNETSSSLRRSFYTSDYSSYNPYVVIQWEPFEDGTAYLLKTGTSSALDGGCVTLSDKSIIKSDINYNTNKQYYDPKQLWVAKLSLTGGYIFYSTSVDKSLCTDNNGNILLSKCTSETNPYYCWLVEKVSDSRYAIKNMYNNKWIACKNNLDFVLTSTQSERQLFSFTSDFHKYYYDKGYSGQSGKYHVNIIFDSKSIESPSQEYNFGTIKAAVERWNGICDNISVSAYYGSLPSSAPTGINVNVYRKDYYQKSSNDNYAMFWPNGNKNTVLPSEEEINAKFDALMNTDFSGGVIFINNDFSTLPPEEKLKVLTHEVGHALKLRHIKSKVATSPNVSDYIYYDSMLMDNRLHQASVITPYDKSNFIKKWRYMP